MINHDQALKVKASLKILPMITVVLRENSVSCISVGTNYAIKWDALPKRISTLWFNFDFKETNLKINAFSSPEFDFRLAPTSKVLQVKYSSFEIRLSILLLKRHNEKILFHGYNFPHKTSRCFLTLLCYLPALVY